MIPVAASWQASKSSHQLTAAIWLAALVATKCLTITQMNLK
jgi:hypothetical protein